ncbi:hypothetical protein [Terrimonas pollutisoli]|uniref:hypothetical protein n=1 Tax=Terrimonas pollutisoli TaxID=3034147 RepID=UPI0023EDA377|nr:hypothetical protein [Terrimonas sp. H1YJ31]
MSDKPQYEVLKQFADNSELLQALQTGNYDDKKHALLNIAYSDSEGEAALDLFLTYLKDPELKYVAYLSINMFLETCRSYPLFKILPVLITGIGNEEQYISSRCASSLENLISPGKITDETLTFSSFGLDFNNQLLPDYLNSSDPQQIIIALLYLFHHPHKDQELFQILNDQLTKNNKAVTCIIGEIIDTKLWSIIEQINGLEEISLTSYQSAIAAGLKSKATWVYDRFDEMQELAKEQMNKLKPDETNGR